MGLTILAIPFLVLGVLISPFTLATERCFIVKVFGRGPYCFADQSLMPEFIKYACVIIAFGLFYFGREQIKRARGLQ